MIKKTFLFIVLLLSAAPSYANNINVSNVRLLNKEASLKTYDVTFNVAWENSWRDAMSPSSTQNWDAAWVFCKFSKWNGTAWGEWAHCTIDTTVPSGQPAGLAIDIAATGGAGKGAFLYSAATHDTAPWAVNWQNAKIRWKYGTDGIANEDRVKVQVFGIEMVYIPQAAFVVGDVDAQADANDFNSFYTYGCAAEPCSYAINSEGAISLGAVNGDLFYRSTFFFMGGDLQAASVPAAFPKGYGAFYLMKYEVSQGQYRDFLNTLTRTQQNIRVDTKIAVGDTSSANVYVMTDTGSVEGRSGIRCPGVFDANDPIVFGCDLNGNGTFNEADDGEWVAAGYLSWDDLLAYADWASLRPYTEFEFEKAARGPLAALADEFPWGDATAGAAPSSVSSGGQTAEVPDQGRMHYNYNAISGPIRTGAFAGAATTRTGAGSGYYGTMDLAGNLSERMFTPATGLGRLFDGVAGDGVLDVNGDADGSHWRDALGADGFGAMAVRGGSWAEFDQQARIADRYWGVDATFARVSDIGGRCARTAP